MSTVRRFLLVYALVLSTSLFTVVGLADGNKKKEPHVVQSQPATKGAAAPRASHVPLMDGDETFYLITDGDNKPPSKQLFTGFLNGRAAGPLNNAVYEETENKFKNDVAPILALSYVPFSVEAIGFRRVKDDPKKVQVIVVTPYRQIVFEKPINELSLDRGISVDLDASLNKDRGSLNATSVNHLKLSYDGAGNLNVLEMKTTIGAGFKKLKLSDVAEFENLTGVKGEVSLRQEEIAK